MFFTRKLKTDVPPPPPTAMELPTTTLSREAPAAPSGNCVLLVDDEPSVLAVGKAILVASGFDVVCAPSGEVALDLIRHAQSTGSAYGAIMLDLTMPGGQSGFDVLASILEIEPAASVIACSGYFQDDARQLCRAIGFYDVLAKPYQVDMLCNTVRRAIMRAPDPETQQQEEPAYDYGHEAAYAQEHSAQLMNA